MGVSAEELAAVTGEQAFQDADLNHDGRLSFDEFQRWYTSTSDQSQPAEDENEYEWDDDDDDSDYDDLPVSLPEARKLTGLGETDVELAFSLFAQVTDENGLIDFRNFSDVFIDIITARDDAELTDRGKLSSLLIRLFSLFDIDGSGAVDFSELASGISVLCGGSSSTKVQEAL
jgi:Ca2+-binding EF-hand superfamily protein